jgi:hypothetical protein
LADVERRVLAEIDVLERALGGRHAE